MHTNNFGLRERTRSHIVDKTQITIGKSEEEEAEEVEELVETELQDEEAESDRHLYKHNCQEENKQQTITAYLRK